MDDSGFPRTPDRPVKLLGTRVRYQRSVETTIDACGPDFLGGSATLHAFAKPREIAYESNSSSLFSLPLDCCDCVFGVK